MKRNALPLTLLTAALFTVCAPLAARASALGTAFTYQGRLDTAVGPVTGSYDFEFSLWNALSGGAQVGATYSLPARAVSNGLFTVTLDFGAAAFAGDARWLQVAVRATGSPGFSTLTPRQELKPTPGAIYASTAGVATMANGVAANSISGVGVLDGSLTAADLGAGQVVKSLNTLKDNVTLAAGSNLTLTPAGQTLTLASPTDWHITGNAGTTPGANFLGTTDNQALWLKVQNAVGWRLVPSSSGIDEPNILGGAVGNFMAPTAKGTTVGGGVSNSVPASVYYGFLGGGFGNSLAYSNTWADYAVLGGGFSNFSTGPYSVLGGGRLNTNSGSHATIPGGYLNAAAGTYSMAAGQRAKANHQGTFVWADAQATDFLSTANNQFLVRASGGVGINKNNPATALDVNGTVTATSFIGPGSGLTGIGTLSLADNSVTSVKIADNSVAAVDLAYDAASLSRVSNGRATVDGNRIVLPSLGAIDTSMFSGLGLQYNASYGESAIMSSFNDGYASLSFYTKGGFGFPVAKQVVIDRYGGVAIDQQNVNNGFINNGSPEGAGLTFGPASGEGIGSKRTSGGNQYGLDFYTGFTPKMNITWGGNVGIGTGTNLPNAKLDVRGAVRLNDNPIFLRGGTDPNHGLVYSNTVAGIGVDGPLLWGYDGGALGAINSSVVDVLALKWDWHGNIWISNNCSVATLTVRGGSDLAEPFPVTGGEEVEPGTVMVIDESQPGHLIRSTHAYDSRVAGIVSGAGGVKPGLELQQEGILDKGQKIALTGRVYVKADASFGAIKPGDLLTTANLPGHAMKVKDRDRAQGAILGKAMTSLDNGTGLVLVLVTLQ